MPVSSPSKTRQRNERRGRWAEGLAVLALRLKGYRLLARRFKSGPGEVDLIMRRGEVTAFIEVKVRGTADLAVEAVTQYQSRRIAAAANLPAGLAAAEIAHRFGLAKRELYARLLALKDKTTQ